MIRAAFCLVTLFTALSCAEVKKVHQFRPLPSAIPQLHITGDTTATALKISMLDIKTVVAANIATTTFDISFYNPNDKILEGEFEFPLADGQHITRYALDMNGSLREGVVVEKAKARIAFETTVRKGIDPGLVEKTKGNNFRTRIYPLPAKGYRRILIAAEQTLEQENKDLLYQLPLYAKDPIDTFSIKITVIKSNAKPQLDENGIALHFNKQKDTYTAELHEKKFIADKTVAFALPGSEENNDIVLTENHAGEIYFYVNSRIEPQHKDKKKPATIGVFWDISSSGEKRDLKKEMELLKQYISRLSNVSVSLVTFNIYTQPKEDFTISGGNADKLINRIEAFTYDGGSQFSAIDLSKYNFDEVLLFSDGLSTFGKEDIIVGKSPVMTITTSPSANYSYLQYIAQQSHGSFIDLGKQETETALKELDGQSLQIINIAYKESEITDLVTQTTPILNTGLSFSGKLKTSSADIKVELGFGNEVVLTKNYTATKNDNSDYDQVKRIWATMSINRMDMEYEKNKQAITRLGKEFSVVTQNTSLLVLDRVEDYVENEIVPPVELQKEYYALLKEKQATEKDKKETAFTEALDAMKGLKEWWNTDYVKRKKNSENEKYTTPVIVADGNTNEASGLVTFDSAHFNYRADSFAAVDSGSVSTQSFYSQGAAAEELKVEATAVPLLRLNMNAVTENFEWKNKEAVNPTAEIELNEWKPDATYVKTLEQTSSKERFAKYLLLKKQYNSQPSFFADVARFFIEKNEKQTGVQVLSNIAEMKLEDAELLRIVANQLMDANEKKLAIETFEQILKMKEEDPQSYRDLALAYNETGEYNKAVELLYKLVLGVWDERFGDVKAIALNEMNAIISAHSGSVSKTVIDQRFVYAMPVDVRIVIGWNTDNSDIDLWVTDPKKEKCFYEHTETDIGGKISRDVTQGYGPEEFLLKKALNGNYTIDVNLYGDHRQTLGGPIAIKADLFTDFGKPTQKRKTINLRVTTDKEVINLGSLKFGS
jgi:hypothetical protein